MPREKIRRSMEYLEVYYDRQRWLLLEEKRRKAFRVMSCLVENSLSPIVHGSIARGDVNKNSDIDVVLLEPVPSFIVEISLERCGFKPFERTIIQATPSSTPKAYLFLDEKEEVVVSFPLAKLQPREREFYTYGGSLDLKGIQENQRVPGVDKRLVLIEPTDYGHRESPVIGREHEVAKIIGVSIETVLERIRVLSRRDEKGRTGVFIKYSLAPEETFETALRKILSETPPARRRWRMS